MPSLGNAIKAARQRRGMTQEELANELDTTKSAISKYELDKREPNLEQLRKIAHILGVTVSDLVDSGYWSRIPDYEIKTAFSDNARRDKLLCLYDQMSELGQQKAVERLEDLLEVAKYRK